MSKRQHFINILILGSLSTISPFAIDMYLPGFPLIADDLGTSIAKVQLSLTSYFVGIAAGQLLYGPLLDRFGRKKPLYIGLVVYILASVGCAFAFDVNTLIGMRFLQAVGGCAGMVASQTFVRDLFPLNKTAQAFSSITLVVAVSPLIAPTVGSFITVMLGWHAVFIVLAVVTALILITVHFVLPAGRRPDRSISLKPRPVVHNFIQVLKQPQFLTYCLAGGLATAAPFAYIAGSSDLMMNVYNATPEEFGWMFALIGAVVIGSTQLNHLFLRRFSSYQMVSGALVYQVIVGAMMIGLALLNLFDKYTIIVAIGLFLAGHGLSNPNSTALALAPFSKHAGSAASLAGSFRMGMGGVASALVSFFHNGTQMPTLVVMVACAASGLLVLLISTKLWDKAATLEEVVPQG